MVFQKICNPPTNINHSNFRFLLRIMPIKSKHRKAWKQMTSKIFHVATLQQIWIMAIFNFFFESLWFFKYYISIFITVLQQIWIMTIFNFFFESRWYLKNFTYCNPLKNINTNFQFLLWIIMVFQKIWKTPMNINYNNFQFLLRIIIFQKIFTLQPSNEYKS